MWKDESGPHQRSSYCGETGALKSWSTICVHFPCKPGHCLTLWFGKEHRKN